LGCGLGRVAEYLSDLTGADFLGVDYSSEAVRQALERTVSRRKRLDFTISNIDNLDFPMRSFDAILSIDSLYMAGDLEATLTRMIKWLRPGGRLAVYWIQMVWDSDGDRSTLLPGNTPLGSAMRRLQLPHETQDVSRETYELMQRKFQLAQAMRPKFEAEDNSALYNFLATESERSPEPYNPETCYLARYLYRSRPEVG
jgi:SAM-dependent methyltransferase